MQTLFARVTRLNRRTKVLLAVGVGLALVIVIVAAVLFVNADLRMTVIAQIARFLPGLNYDLCTQCQSNCNQHYQEWGFTDVDACIWTICFEQHPWCK